MLLNVSYSHFNKRNRWTHDKVFTLLSQNVNSFFLEGTFFSQNDQRIITFMQEKCIPGRFYIFKCQNENFLVLNLHDCKFTVLKKVLEPIWPLSRTLTNSRYTFKIIATYTWMYMKHFLINYLSPIWSEAWTWNLGYSVNLNNSTMTRYWKSNMLTNKNSKFLFHRYIFLHVNKMKLFNWNADEKLTIFL